MKGRREGPLGADQDLPYNEITLRLTKLARANEGGIEDLAAQVAALAATTRVGLLIEGGNRRVVLANQRFCNLFGVPMPPEQLAGGDGADYSRRSKALFADPEGYERRLLSLVMNAHGTVSEDLRLADGRIFQRDYVPLRVGGKSRGHLWMYADVTEERLAAAAAARRERLQELERRVLGALFEERGMPKALDLLLGEVGDAWQLRCARLVRHTSAQTGLVESVEWRPGAPLRRGSVASTPWLEGASVSTMGSARIFRAEGSDLGAPPPIADIAWGMRADGHGTAFLVPVVVYGRPEAVAYFADADPGRGWPTDETATVQAAVDGFARALERRVVERERRVHAQELSGALSRAEAASRFKSQFVAYLSHEIRNPVGAILGYADHLEQMEATPERNQELASHLRRNGQHLLTLLNDVLDLSRVEAGQLDLRISDQDLNLLLDDIVTTLKARADAKGVKLIVHLPPEIPQPFRTDPTRFKQILLNLVGNALKFTERGRVEIIVGVETPDPPARCALLIAVRDTGIGIPADRVAALFLPFSQAHPDSHSKYGGAGLGLAISRALTRQLGGDIAVESVIGEGTTFTVRTDLGPRDQLTLRPPSAARAVQKRRSMPDPHPALRGSRVLCVDDSPDNHRILRFLMERAGIETQEASNGVEALERVHASLRDNVPFDAMLLDMQMPIMDGYEAARQLRALGVRFPIIALTAYTVGEERERSLAVGCDAYLSKPVDPEELYGTLARFITPDFRMTEARGTGPVDGREAEIPIDLAPEPAPEPLDLRSAMADDPSFAPLLERYVVEIQRRAPELRQAFSEKDLVLVGRIAHQVKGSAASYGFPTITEVAAALERALRGSEGGDAEALVDELARHLEAMRGA